MGCFNSKNISTDHDGLLMNQIFDERSLQKKSSTRIFSIELIGEKTGNITKDYNLLSPGLGSGTFGEVKKAMHKASGIVRAVKIIHKSRTNEEEKKKIMNEVNILKSLDHPNIIKVYEFYQDDNELYIVQDLCTGGELFDKIISKKTFDEKLAAETMKQILSAVSYCHSHQIVHRDLKPENLLYESNKPGSLLKVIDFGTSKQFNPGEIFTQKFGTVKPNSSLAYQSSFQHA